jgi:hypothetical protein
MTGHCLNCGDPINPNQKFCVKCGQKTSTHRFSIKHIFSHDFVHGVFHLDKGFFFTIKELLTRPGHSIREYIEGKRVRHFNYFTLLLLTMTIEFLLRQLSPVNARDLFDDTVVQGNETIGYYLDKLLNEYPKLFMLVAIPLYAVFSALLFRRANLNFAEHIVLNAFRGAGEVIISLSFSLFMIVVHDIETLKAVNFGFSLLIIVYSTIFYYQFFSTFGYKRLGLLTRSFLAAIAFSIFIAVVIGVVANVT